MAGVIPEDPQERSRYFADLGRASARRRQEIRKGRRIDALILALTEAAPALTEDQKQRIAALLQPRRS
jgi:hypothetical protein